MLELIERLVNASLGTRGSATDSVNCSRRLEAPWDKAFRSPARIAKTAYRFLSNDGSAKRTFWPRHFQ